MDSDASGADTDRAPVRLRFAPADRLEEVVQLGPGDTAMATPTQSRSFPCTRTRRGTISVEDTPDRTRRLLAAAAFARSAGLALSECSDAEIGDPTPTSFGAPPLRRRARWPGLTLAAETGMSAALVELEDLASRTAPVLLSSARASGSGPPSMPALDEVSSAVPFGASPSVALCDLRADASVFVPRATGAVASGAAGGDVAGGAADADGACLGTTVQTPAGYSMLPEPSTDVLSRGGTASSSIVDCPVYVCWPGAGWCLGHIVAVAPSGALDRGGQATFEVHYCDDPAQPGIATMHAYHHLSSERYAADGDWGWLLLAPIAPFDAGCSTPGTRGCGWAGCPGFSMAFSPVRLLQHARQAHSGQLDDTRIRWTCAVRCITCALPYVPSGLRQHLRRDPTDGVRRCPSAMRAVAGDFVVAAADEVFVRGLTADEVYIRGTPSLIELSPDAARDVGAIVAPLMAACQAAPRDEYRGRLLHVVLTALLGPVGNARRSAHVVAERCRSLRAGGALEVLWRATPPPPRGRRARRPARDVGSDADDEDERPEAQPRQRTAAEAQQRRRSRATSLVHAAEVGAARRCLEATSQLGELRQSDVLRTGVHGEVLEARDGSVTAEMQGKHPAAGAGDEQLPDLDTLLQGALQDGGEVLTRYELRHRREELFCLHDFERYVGRLPRRRMPACDMVRFEHVRALCRAGYTQQVRDYVLLFG